MTFDDWANQMGLTDEEYKICFLELAAIHFKKLVKEAISVLSDPLYRHREKE